MKIQFGAYLVAGLACFVISSTQAKDVFFAQINVDQGSYQTQGYSNISDAIDQYASTNMKLLFPNYTETTYAHSALNLRGVNTQLEFAKDSPQLQFSIPSLGIHKTYGAVGGTREQAKEEFLNALKGEDSYILKALTKEWVKNTAIDPVAGNPNSLMSTMSVSTTDAMSDMTSNHALGAKTEGSRSSFGIAPRFGRYTQGDYGIDVYNLPLTYSHWFAGNKIGLAIDAPITLVDTEGAYSGSINLGVGVNVKAYENKDLTWFVMPQVRVGATGSEDLGSAAIIYGGGLVSNLQFPLSWDASINIINMATVYKTDSIQIGDYETHYDLKNTVLRNGVEYSQVLKRSINNSPLIAKVSLARTDFHGDELYTEVSHDISASIGFKNLKPNAWISDYRIGATYTYTDNDLKGFMVNMGYTF
ncbi:hypothetical protein [Acinetobacter sp. CFCC 10889]|uniref:hypothetical protein n=1 Tax=Acinetobacter sp. CFCC 10889 TaxID=1775557 RepID=UPI000DD0ED19|nr:hypothetical protein [Acinetobacter sp. CFCC 10889]